LDSNDLVSVLVPVYNSEKFLNESIESVLNQTYKNIEVIAIDDGSTDNSLKVLHQYSDRINILSQENQGLATAINAGINTMKGKWFKWFSPDDVLYPEAIQTLVKAARNLPENTITYSNWEIVDENGKKLREFSESNFNDLSKFDYNVRLLDGQQVNVNTSLIPCSLFKKGCEFRSLPEQVAIDHDFFMNAALIFDTKFHLIPTSLIKYRIHKGQLSHRNITKTLDYLQKIKNEILSKLDEKERIEYINALKEYKMKKPLSKKAMNVGLKLVSSLPPWVSDNVLTLYLNKLRSSR